MSDTFTNRMCVVTGASAGIGRALAGELVRRGARVIAAARSIERLQELRRELGERLLPAAVDLTSEESVGGFGAWVNDEIGAVDYLVNNAGIGHMDAFLDTNPAQWREAVDTNLYGPLFLIRSLLPRMLAAGRGVIVNVGSSAAAGWPYMTLYAASKAALHAATLSIEREIAGRGVRLLSVEIGPTNGTDFGTRFNRGKIDNATRRWKELGLPFDRPVSPEASAQTIISAIEDAAIG